MRRFSATPLNTAKGAFKDVEQLELEWLSCTVMELPVFGVRTRKSNIVSCHMFCLDTVVILVSTFGEIKYCKGADYEHMWGKTLPISIEYL